MRLFILILSLFSAVAWAGAPFEGKDQVDHFISHYHENPQPEQILPLFRHLQAQSLLAEKGSHPPLAGFFSGALAKHPAQQKAWVTALEALPVESHGIFILGLWHSGLPGAQAEVQRWLKAHPEVDASFQSLGEERPRPIQSIALDQGAWVIDLLWGYYGATGDEEVVRQVIQALKWRSVDDNIHLQMIGEVASVSLMSRAQNFPAVKAIIESEAKIQSMKIARELRAILKALDASPGATGP